MSNFLSFRTTVPRAVVTAVATLAVTGMLAFGSVSYAKTRYALATLAGEMQREIRREKPLFDRLEAEERKCDDLPSRNTITKIPTESELRWQIVSAEGKSISPGYWSLFSYRLPPQQRCREEVTDAIVQADDAQHTHLRTLMVARLNTDMLIRFGPISAGVATTFTRGPLNGFMEWVNLWRMQHGGMPLD